MNMKRRSYVKPRLGSVVMIITITATTDLRVYIKWAEEHCSERLQAETDKGIHSY